MAIKGLNLQATENFIFSGDPDKDDPNKATVFVIGTLDSILMAWLNDKLTEYTPGGEGLAKATVPIFSQSIETCRVGIRSWRNFSDVEGVPITLDLVEEFIGGKGYQVVPTSLISRIPMDVLREMATKIKKLNAVTKDEEENSVA